MLPPLSGLGPPVYACPCCGTAYLSGRREWDDFSPVYKVLYLLLTLVYILFAAGSELGCLFIAVEALGGKPRAALLWPGPVFAAAWVAGVQALRVRCSRRRARGGPARPFCIRLWDIQTGVVWKTMVVLLLAAPVLAWVIRAAAGGDFYP
jgi:hypothetical protein